MSIDGIGQARALAQRLKYAGPQGQGLRRELQKALREAAAPVAREIGGEARMDPYMPDRYAGVLSRDLDVTVRSSLAGDPSVTIHAKAREHARKIGQIEDGYIVHPVFAQGPRRRPRSAAVREALARKHGIPASAIRGWTWIKEPQTKGMRPGFFTDPCWAAEPDIRDRLLKAMDETARKITGNG